MRKVHHLADARKANRELFLTPEEEAKALRLAKEPGYLMKSEAELKQATKEFEERKRASRNALFSELYDHLRGASQALENIISLVRQDYPRDAVVYRGWLRTIRCLEPKVNALFVRPFTGGKVPFTITRV